MSHHYLTFNNVHYTYPNGYKAVSGLNFTIAHGEKVAVTGANGAGKSTLMLLSNGLLLPDEGYVDVGGVKVSDSTLAHIRRNVGLVFQNADDQLFMPTVHDDVAFGLINMGLPPDEVELRVNKVLDNVGVLHLKDHSCHRLSGGQKRVVAIAGVLAMEPNILVMDEPSSNLDPKARRMLINIIGSFTHTCVIATHDLELVWELCPRTIVINHGSIMADGHTHDIFRDTALLEKAGLEQPLRAKFSL